MLWLQLLRLCQLVAHWVQVSRLRTVQILWHIANGDLKRSGQTCEDITEAWGCCVKYERAEPHQAAVGCNFAHQMNADPKPWQGPFVPHMQALSSQLLQRYGTLMACLISLVIAKVARISSYKLKLVYPQGMETLPLGELSS